MTTRALLLGTKVDAWRDAHGPADTKTIHKNKLYHFHRFLAARPSGTCDRPKKADIGLFVLQRIFAHETLCTMQFSSSTNTAPGTKTDSYD